MDGSPEAAAANVIYASTIQAWLRKTSWDFARKELALTLSGISPPINWQQEYIYPSDCIEVRQIQATAGFTYDPQPVRWAVGSNITPVKVIWTNQTAATIVYTYSAPESEWDTLFIETAVRAVAAALSMSIGGRPDFAKQKLEEAQAFVNLAESRYW